MRNLVNFPLEECPRQVVPAAPGFVALHWRPGPERVSTRVIVAWSIGDWGAVPIMLDDGDWKFPVDACELPDGRVAACGQLFPDRAGWLANERAYWAKEAVTA